MLAKTCKGQEGIRISKENVRTWFKSDTALACGSSGAPIILPSEYPPGILT
jgi:hypothetical protein